MSYIIEQVKRRRQERNWSQKYIADCINVSQSFIYKAVIYIFTLTMLGLKAIGSDEDLPQLDDENQNVA